MPSVIGYVDELEEEEMKKLIESGKFENQSEFVHKAVQYYLDQKYGLPER